MKILLANSTAYPVIGGVENSLSNIGRELIRAGHEVKVFCFQFSPDEPMRMEHEGIEIIRHPCMPERWPHNQFLSRVAVAKQVIPSILNEFQPDTVWSRAASVGLGIRQGGFKGSLLQIFPTSARMNCLGTFLQTYGLPAWRRLMLLGLWPTAYFVSVRIERELSRQCESVAFSDNIREQLLMEFPVDARPCHKIPPGVDCEVFSPDNGARFFQFIENEYGLSRSEPIVLYVGRLSCAKNIPLLMDAVLAMENGAKLVLVGSGPEESRLRAYAQRIGLSENIVFAGLQHEKLPGFYAISSVCVLPTTIESFGQVYLESLASGTPVVGFAGDGRRVLTATDEIVRDGVTGFVVHEVNFRALAEKIDLIISLDSKVYADMAKHARDDVRSRFSWCDFVDKALTLSVT
ncbi:glycosyltransferase family 4 protein [Thermodesulfobacteriota bacterium]